MAAPDGQLIRSALTGDKQAFSELVRRHQGGTSPHLDPRLLLGVGAARVVVATAVPQVAGSALAHREPPHL